MSGDFLKSIREVRNLKTPKLKKSPYFKDSFKNEFGKEIPLIIRDYQVIGIMNMLMVPNMILADDTGLGKTLQILATLGYIWMKEPEFVPIIITNKSALFQWSAEVDKMMEGVETIIISGSPIDRHNSYKSFFEEYDPNKKRMIILTYDSILNDFEEDVIREKSKNPYPGFAKTFDTKKKELKEFQDLMGNIKSVIKSCLINEPESIKKEANDYINEMTVKKVSKLSPKFKTELDNYLSINAKMNKIAEKVESMKEELSPSRIVKGIRQYMEILKVTQNVKYALIMDEMHKLKNHKSKIHEKVHDMSKMSDRIVGMTATPVKNRLMEFWSLFRIIEPKLFPVMTHFQNKYCVMKMQRIGGGRQVPIVVGYKNLDDFTKEIELFYLSRKKYEVAKELPVLISNEVYCQLSPIQEELYELAESLEDDGDDEEQGSSALKILTMCQQAVDAPQLIENDEGEPFEGPSSKIETLIEMLSEGISGQKVIVFSRFEKMISLVGKELEKNDIKYVRITGKENNAKVRNQNRDTFQDIKSGVDVILITMAGSESLNLQSAEHFIFLDLPWSIGDYIQLIGRMVRIGSSYATVICHHFIAKSQNRSDTIDHYVLSTLRSKQSLSDQVSGVSLKDGLKFNDEDVVNEIIGMMRSGSHRDKKNHDRGKLLEKASVFKSKKNKALKSKEKISKSEVIEKQAIIMTSGGIDFSDI